MELEYLNWDNVPQHVSVIAHKDGTVNFVLNLRVMGEDSRWVLEGDECNICGDVINPDEGWPNGWRVLERPATETHPAEVIVLEHTAAIVNWLGKLEHVLVKDPTVGYGLLMDSEDTLTLSTDFADLIGSEEIVEFINNRYSQLIEQANNSKREELLAEIVKAKSEYEKLVGELKELEGK